MHLHLGMCRGTTALPPKSPTNIEARKHSRAHTTCHCARPAHPSPNARWLARLRTHSYHGAFKDPERATENTCSFFCCWSCQPSTSRECAKQLEYDRVHSVSYARRLRNFGHRFAIIPSNQAVTDDVARHFLSSRVPSLESPKKGSSVL